MPAAIDVILEPRTQDIGVPVRRLIPQRGHRQCGPFVFFDHMGPVEMAPGEGIDVRPHPHIGLATVTYLFEGAFMHRDSLGTVQRIEPGAVNWMSAGAGIVHSERSPDDLRASGAVLHGIQTWVALPQDDEQSAPWFRHYPAHEIPVVRRDGATLHVIAGDGFGARSPVQTASRTFYVCATLEAGASLVVPADHVERGVYLVEGEITLDGTPLALHHAALLARDARVELKAGPQGARTMLFGGDPLDGPRYIEWNFVASRRELIEDAKHAWREQRFAKVPGETEWIPLPGAAPAERDAST
ncbi:pirin family protein [Pararobbsia silviterrae]|uniref:Pirin family protein n=1 Tax=Pararobbsia silviterrae TaxID=1792498 RepID=A0A494Y2L6_9BURK|nr:pirin family protein [Pararobbsia silviterrae]RKP56529.1 pirin family protein [Pararobbsia silviterrae]